MSVSPSNPYDAFFRGVLSRAADATGELRAMVPKSLAARVDWEGLVLESCSFVSKELRSRYSDLLFKTRLDGHEAYIYMLVEHQSGSDRLMAFRMLDYLVNIWHRHLHQNPKARGLPAVVPLVVHSDRDGRAWRAPMELAELIEVHPEARAALGPLLPQLRYLLDDVAVLDLEILRARELTPAARVMLSLLKIAPGNKNLGEEMLPLVEDLRAILASPSGVADLEAVVTFILVVGDTGEAGLGPVIDRLGPRVKEAIMTTAERLRAEGEARGEARGEAKGRAEALLELLHMKFGVLPTHVADLVNVAGPDSVRSWMGRVLTAATLDEIFDE